jgi:hypothetical protein
LPPAAEGKPFSPTYLLLAAAVAAVIGLVILVWRVWTIRRIYARSVEVSGNLSEVAVVKDRAKLVFKFEYAGGAYECGCSVHLNRRSRKLKQGSAVAVLLDPADPRRALIRDLFD